MTTQVELEQKVQELTDLLDQFVNGQAGQTVAISGGRTIGTLATIDQNAYKTKYVQKIFDYKFLADAQSDATANILDQDNVVRVFGETDIAKNRLYQIQADKSLLPIDYTDVYNLREPLPYPYNAKVVRQNLAQMADAANRLLTITVEPSSVKTYNLFLTGKIKVVSHKTGSEGMSGADFRMLVSMEGNVIIQTFGLDNAMNLSASGMTYPVTYPALTAVLDTSLSPGNNTILIKPSWTQTTFANNDPVMIEWLIDSFDKTPYY